MKIVGLVCRQKSDGGIGYNGKLLFDFKEDKIAFRRQTTSHVIVMGRKTYESMGSKQLPNRYTYVMTRTPGLEKPFTVLQPFLLIEHVRKCHPGCNLYICGGAGIYKAFLPFYDEIISVEVDDTIKNLEKPYNVSTRPSDVAFDIPCDAKCDFIVANSERCQFRDRNLHDKECNLVPLHMMKYVPKTYDNMMTLQKCLTGPNFFNGGNFFEPGKPGLGDLFGSSRNPFGSRRNPFGSRRNPFGSSQNLFKDVGNPFPDNGFYGVGYYKLKKSKNINKT